MSFHRVFVVAAATLFSIGMTSLASASCCGWGYSAPVAYATVAPAVYGGCGTCGAPTAAVVYAQPVAPAPIVVNPVVPTSFGGPCCSWGGCGNCGYSDWSGGCGSCGVTAWNGCNSCGVTAWNGCNTCGVAYSAPYVVNQGPVYSGAGIMAYQTYSPDTAYVPATDYPYAPGYGASYGPGYGYAPGYGAGYGPGYGYGYGAVRHYGAYYRRPYYYRPRVAYRGPYVHRYYGAPRWRHYP